MTLGWLEAFLLTTLLELPIVLLLSRELDESLSRRAAVVVLAQLVTHPIVWFVFPFVPGITGWTSLVLSELWAWLGEAILYAVAFRSIGGLRAFGISGVANAASFAAGLLLHGK